MKEHHPINLPESCKICGGGRLRGYCQKEMAKYYTCGDCGIIFQYPRPSEATMIEYVNEEYQDGHYGEYVAAREMKIDHFRWRMKTIKPYLKPGRLLDVGCSCGYFLEVAAGEGYDVHGLEFSASAIAAANAALQLRISRESIDRLKTEHRGSFQVVTAFDLIEHLDQPKDFLRKTWGLLSKGGALAISTPDAQHFLRYL